MLFFQIDLNLIYFKEKLTFEFYLFYIKIKETTKSLFLKVCKFY